jgi:cytoplasmic FMR1 interacting protein
MLLSELLRNLYLKISNILGPYVAALTAGLPPSSKLPLHEYGVEGCHGMFSMKLRELVDYPDLKPEVLQNFRELGNSMVFVELLDQILKQTDLASYILAAPALGLTPETLTTPIDDPTHSAPLYQVVASSSKHLDTFSGLRGTPATIKELVLNAWHADRFNRTPDYNMSLFRTVLSQVNSMIDTVRPEWIGRGHPPDNGILDVEGPYEFYRLWSALEVHFLFLHISHFLVCFLHATEE